MTRGSSGCSRRLTWAVGMSTALLVPPVCAQLSTGAGISPGRGWIITPTLTTSETYTDNVQLAPAGSQRTEWVTTVSPGVTVAATGARLRFNATYAPQLLYRANEETRSTFQTLAASGNAELVRQFLFVDTSANVGQTNTSIVGRQTNSNVNDTGNRTSVGTFSVSPFLRHKFGVDAEGVARYTYSAVSYSAAAGSTAAPPTNSHQTGISLGLTSGPAYKFYTWNVGYNRQTLSRAQVLGQNQDTTTQSITAGGRRLITYQVYLVSSLSYTKSDYQTTGAAANHGITSSYGLQWTPTPRTNLQATLGKSYYGDNRGLDFSHRSGRSVWSANYAETVSTTHSQFASPSAVSTASLLDPLFVSRFPDPAVREQAVKDYISQNGLPSSTTVSRNLLSEQIFLSKRLSASTGIMGVRNTVLASVFRQKSENQSVTTTASAAGDFAQSSSNTVTGANLNWSSRLSPVANANLSVSYSRNELPGIAGDRLDRTKFVQLGLTRRFARGQSGTLSFHKSQTDSNQSNASYTENAMTATLGLRY